MTSFLSGIGSSWVNDEDYEDLMNKYPLLKNCNGGTRLPDEPHVKAAFLCAGYAYLTHRPKRAHNLIRALLECNDVPVEISCAGSIFLALIMLELNDFSLAANILQTLVTVPQWIESSDNLKNAFAIVNTRINLKKDITYKCPELSGKKVEDIEWLTIRLESGLRDGSYRTVLKPLIQLRKLALNEGLVKIDMTLGDLYFRGFENLDLAEIYYKEALEICYEENIYYINLLRPIVYINYELGSIFMCNNKPYTAFYSLLIGLPAVAYNPEGWMRLAQSAILCQGSNDFSIRETNEEIEFAKQRFVTFYETESNRNIANEVVQDNLFLKEYLTDNLKPEPTYNFALKCIRKACHLVRDSTKEYVHLHFDLMTMFIFLTTELKEITQSLQVLNTLVKMIKGGILNRNIYAVFRARLYLIEDKMDEAVNELNSITYPVEETRKVRPNRSNNYCQALDAVATESCYDHAFSFISIEAMRLKFIYNVIKIRNQCREILKEKNFTRNLKHASDRNASMFD